MKSDEESARPEAEMNEQELEQISGGSGSDEEFTYRCPVCGAERVSYRSALVCMRCAVKTGKTVMMQRVSN